MAKKFFHKRGELELLAGSMACESMQDGFERQNVSLKAEEMAAREALGIKEPPAESDEGGEVSRQTVVGDYIQQPPTVVYPPTPQQSQRSPILGTVLATALAVGVPGAGALGFGLAKMLGDKVETKIIEKVGGDDTRIEIGLKRFSDLQLE